MNSLCDVRDLLGFRDVLPSNSLCLHPTHSVFVIILYFPHALHFFFLSLLHDLHFFTDKGIPLLPQSLVIQAQVRKSYNGSVVNLGTVDPIDGEALVDPIDGEALDAFGIIGGEALDHPIEGEALSDPIGGEALSDPIGGESSVDSIKEALAAFGIIDGEA